MKISTLIDIIKKRWLVLAILFLLLIRVFIHLLLYQAGFISLTADEFSRTFLAASWSQHPVIYWHGVWLPFHTYLLGAALFLKWDLLWVPRAVTIISGCVSIVLMYFLTLSLFENRVIGLISAFLFSLNPAHIWLSATPLTEVPNTAFILLALWAFSLYLKNTTRTHLFTAAFALLMANGFRFESWLISFLFSSFLFIKNFPSFVKTGVSLKKLSDPALALLIPWLFPLGWLLGNYLETHNPLYFIEAIRGYKWQWYAHAVSYGKYLETFLKIDPFVTLLSLFGLLVCIRQIKKSPAMSWYIGVTTAPLVVYILMSGGQAEPPGNYIRYLSPFIFLFYPAIAYLLFILSQIRRSNFSMSGIILLLAIIAATQIQTVFKFTNDPASDGLAVGLAIRELREKTPESVDRPVMIELTYWQYLAIHIGANDINNILYDRTLDLETRNSQSLFLTEKSQIMACLKSKNISTIVVKDEQLRSVIENEWMAKPEKEVNGFAFYPVDDILSSYAMPQGGAPCK